MVQLVEAASRGAFMSTHPTRNLAVGRSRHRSLVDRAAGMAGIFGLANAQDLFN
jgi:hypothetical protein